MKWLKELIKHRVVRSYLQRLPRYLRKSHGKADHYSPKQISTGIEQLKLSDKFTLYAVAAMSSENASKLYAQEMQLNEDALLIRHEIADVYLYGNRNFTIDDINAYAGIDDSDEADILSGD